jgi:type II secretory pathway component PulC
LLCVVFLPLIQVTGHAATNTVAIEQMKAEQQTLLQEAEQIRQQAQSAVEETQRAVAERNAGHAGELARMREELSRAHRHLRDVSRQVAQAHRELERAGRPDRSDRLINLGDRPVLGVVLGEDNKAGVEIIGISPDGPAERAGLHQGDVLVAIAGVRLNEPDHDGRSALFNVMEGVSPGDELALEVLRDGEARQFTVTAEQREPSAWQSIIRLPEPPADAPDAPDAPLAPRIMVERLRVPDIDEVALASRIEEISKQVQKFESMFSDENGKPVDFSHPLELDGAPFSRIGEHFMREANVWFGLPQARGLELASLNPELGKYFKAERGVLVVQARADNAYGLKSGDVIESVGATAVESPGDLLRALRDAEPGTEVELVIKRDRRSHKLQAKVPEQF